MQRYVLDRQKLSDQIAALLEREIIEGIREVGDRLPSERDLMGQFGVGRPAVREALHALQKRGLIEITSGTPARVIRPSAEVILDEVSSAARRLLAEPGGQEHFQQARSFFEVGLARYATEKATPSDLRRLERALAANRAALGDREAFKTTDVAFHYVLAEIPRNPIFPAIHAAMVDWLTDQRETTLRVPGQMEIAYRAHERIYKAVTGGPPDRAERAMRAHLTQLYRVYRQVRAAEAAMPVRGSAQSEEPAAGAVGASGR